jgi:hypothetical protein
MANTSGNDHTPRKILERVELTVNELIGLSIEWARDLKKLDAPPVAGGEPRELVESAVRGHERSFRERLGNAWNLGAIALGWNSTAWERLPFQDPELAERVSAVQSVLHKIWKAMTPDPTKPEFRPLKAHELKALKGATERVRALVQTRESPDSVNGPELLRSC